MDLAETMKNVLAKGIQQASVNDLPTSTSVGFAASAGYVTEKLYMLLQLYLQNKGWNPSVELLQCFTELKESSMLPSAAYLQMMSSRVTLDSQGRLILRENGKIILPFEHFANAVMLKHMNGPHGLHLGLEATVRAVMESYTIGRENFGMEKEFIIEVVQNCPNPACRYYKNQMELTQKTMQHLAGAPTYLPESQNNSADLRNANFSPEFPMPIPPPNLNSHMGMGSVDMAGPNNLDKGSIERPKSVAPSQQQLTAALIQQQNRVIAQQNLDKLNANLEKQRQQMQLQQHIDMAKNQQKQHYELPPVDPKLSDFLRANLDNLEGFSSANKDLLALHNGAWSNSNVNSGNDEKRSSSGSEVGQEKIVRAFAEVMKNMQRMKTYVRPAMCKPYGKQSEALQKTLMDTIQLIQSLRSFLPPPHIQVSSWKNEDKHRFEET
ncbi:uncharacterized protein LOC108737720 [Agrilus planipennis]|uniref:Uncharacterized protein LOC108737720 n=1 Tax=Agrilus planipennis TaxID=224129 RepID=A0A1W4X1U5_AGRPL|nr:uncharacterized protein LOC108737720 [Agrilus planipennis]